MANERFEWGQELWQCSPVCLSRGRRTADNHPVLLKRIELPEQHPAAIAQLRDEFETSQTIRHGDIVPVVEYWESELGPVLVMEDAGDAPLSCRPAKDVLAVDEFLSISCTILSAVETLHRMGMTHRSIEPRHMFYDAAKRSVRLSGLGSASSRLLDIPSLTAVNRIEGSLAYLSPEQTGRMNRPVDRRSDLYSVGVVLFELATGRVPFEDNDAPGLLHAQIAREAPLLTDLREDVPAAFADIVAKLLRKSPDDRYQTASGLLFDLKKCHDDFLSIGSVPDFPLATHDTSDRLQFPVRIYGRQSELDTLYQQCDQACDGPAELVLVAGYSGVGKTALVRELYRPITRRFGYFIAGKHDVFQQSGPYFALTQALDELCTYLLSLEECQLEQ